MFAVRHVQPEYIYASFDKVMDNLAAIRGRAQRGNDFGLAAGKMGHVDMDRHLLILVDGFVTIQRKKK
jgi:hypothetical protein